MDILTILDSGLSQLFSSTSAAFALAAIGLGVHFGYAGLLNFGQAGFMAVGAYAYAIFTEQVDPTASWGWPPILAFLLAIVVALSAACAFALILGIPTLRLRGDYLAIVTIASAEIIRFTARTDSLKMFTGGSQGISQQRFAADIQSLNPFPRGETFGFWIFEAGANETFIRLIAWTLVAVAVLVVWMLMRSPWGRVIKGIREDEEAVRSLGKNVYSYKMQALVLGGILGALAGIMYSLTRSIQPDSYATPMTFYIWTALLLGGAATTFGPVIGAVLFWVLLTMSDGVIGGLFNLGVFGAITGTQAGQLRFVLVGVALMLLVIFRPQGIMGNKKELSFNV